MKQLLGMLMLFAFVAFIVGFVGFATWKLLGWVTILVLAAAGWLAVGVWLVRSRD